MKLTMHGVVKAAGALALAGSVLFAAAAPAAAASPNRSYAASASGPISHGPIGEATFPGTSPVTLANANISGLLTTGVVHDTAGPTSASSTIANVVASLGKLLFLRATSVASSCTFNTNTGAVSGSARLADGRVTGLGVPIFLASNPRPNTRVAVPGIGTITLNRQRTAADGTLTVQAIYVTLFGTAQTLSLGVSVCNDADLAPVPILPGQSAPIALGGLALLLLFGAGYQLSRRRRHAAAA